MTVKAPRRFLTLSPRHLLTPSHLHRSIIMTFCTDIDLLHWEPNILRDAAFASQTLI